MYGSLWPKKASKKQAKEEGCLSTAGLLNGHGTKKKYDGTVTSGNNKELLQFAGLRRGKKYEHTNTWKTDKLKK